MSVLLQYPNTSKFVTLPSSLIGATPTIIQHHIECHPPTFPSDASWDILYPVPESLIITFTRPPLAERSYLRKAALVQTRKELVERQTTFEERLKVLEEKIREVDAVKVSQKAAETAFEKQLKLLGEEMRTFGAVKLSQKVILRREVDRQIHVLKFETYTRLLQVLNDDLMSRLSADRKVQMKKYDLDYLTSILEGIYPRGPLEQSPHDRLLCLIGRPIFPTFQNPTKRMKLSREALDTMPEDRVQLAVQLYHVIHKLRDGDSQRFKTTWNQLQHPRPSIRVAMLALIALTDSNIPFDFDTSTANDLIKAEAEKDTGIPQSSLFGKKDDPALAELLEYL